MIGPCDSSDLEQVADLVNMAYRGEGGEAGWTSEIDLVEGRRTTVAALTEDLAASAVVVILILRENNQLNACVRVALGRGAHGESACYIGMLAVRPGLQDRGLGRTMLEQAEAQGRGWGAQVARMTVVSIRESLVAWYERRLYRRTGEIEAFPHEETRFGTPLRADLKFVVMEKSLSGGSATAGAELR